MFWKSCSFGYTEHNKIGFAIFGFFDFILNLQVAAKTIKGGKNHFAHKPLERLKSSQICPRFAQNSLEVPVALQCSPRDQGAARLAKIRQPRRRSWPGKGLGRS
jgi:hypothetical protein